MTMGTSSTLLKILEVITLFTWNIQTDMPEQTVDPDQMLLKEQFDLGLHCLPVFQYIAILSVHVSYITS